MILRFNDFEPLMETPSFVSFRLFDFVHDPQKKPVFAIFPRSQRTAHFEEIMEVLACGGAPSNVYETALGFTATVAPSDARSVAFNAYFTDVTDTRTFVLGWSKFKVDGLFRMIKRPGIHVINATKLVGAASFALNRHAVALDMPRQHPIKRALWRVQDALVVNETVLILPTVRPDSTLPGTDHLRLIGEDLEVGTGLLRTRWSSATNAMQALDAVAFCLKSHKQLSLHDTYTALQEVLVLLKSTPHEP